MNAPLPTNEQERLAFLREARILDTPVEVAFDDITQLAAQICGVPIAAVSLIDEERQWFKSIIGLDVTETPRDQAFCAHAILQSETLIVPNALVDERFADNPLVTTDPNIRFYAGAPLLTSDGVALGSLCVIDRVARELTEEQQAVLEMLARQVAGRIELQRRVELQKEMMAEYQQTQEALRESEARLRLALESGYFGTWGFDLKTGQSHNASTQTKALFGLPPDAPFSQTEFFKAVVREDRALVRESAQRAIESHGRSQVEFRIVWPDGSIHWLCAHATPQYDTCGDPVAVMGITQDITVRKAREAEQERLLKQAQEQADHDPLTGLWNHRAFHFRLQEETARAEREGSLLAVVMIDLNNFKFFNDVYGHAMGDHVLRQMANKLLTVCRAYDTVARFGGDEFALLLPAIDDFSQLDLEARLRSELVGISFRPMGAVTDIPITVSIGAAVLSALTMDQHDVLQRADERLRRAKMGGAVESEADLIRASMSGSVQGFSIMDALVIAVDNKDRYTRTHSEDVMVYSLMIADQLGLDEKIHRTVAVSALLHDVGKIGVPDAVLRKPGKLSEAEFETIKQHPVMGVIMVGAIPGLEDTLDAVRHHHERWDGDGYPDGLSGEAIPLIARIMAVADAFSAMTTDRPYRSGMDHEHALKILVEGQGIQWDETCVQAFLKAQQRVTR
ncbi:hypothetical protein CCAX7_60110 [Capsulimonas corticalis]|uniref:Uncharacterized protein n=1 Tax=Capsulimonas corticalis TaxID=2219043 RepID=A0A402D799_9BACT|nr:HD domain-containing phosphohydrolase [Capsulimonas corticalis]BDI33960.1 hypothetical protein CCAX7_60110 [Capsulimonas corticalis]